MPAQRKNTKKKIARRRAPAAAKKRRRAPRKWSAKVTATSNAMDLKSGVFKGNDPKKIARSVKLSSGRSSRRKSNAYRSAVSMISFYENRGGKNLSGGKKRILQRAKGQLKKEFHRE
jgi:hypothetical protein